MKIDTVLNLKQELDDSPPHKDWLDKYLFKSLTKKWGALRNRETMQREVVRADVFVKMVLPFSNTLFKREEATIQTVCPENVLGGHYLGHFPVDTDELPGLLNILNSYAYKDSHAEQALYTQIGEFPLYVPFEGKNRVTLFRLAQRPIQALVNQTVYPDPELLTLRQVRPFKDCFALELMDRSYDYSLYRQQLISISDDSTVAIIAFNESVTFFEDYGVRWGRPIYSLAAPLKKRQCRLATAHRFYRR